MRKRVLAMEQSGIVNTRLVDIAKGNVNGSQFAIKIIKFKTRVSCHTAKRCDTIRRRVHTEGVHGFEFAI